jgi:formylglycine-generating enzyme required for sulfatase activity
MAVLAVPAARKLNLGLWVKKIEMVKIPAGSFQMGFAGWTSWEIPVHTVTIRKGFFLGKTEVTQAQWKAVMGSNPSTFWGPSRPVENVSWDDVQEFIRRLNKKEGRNGAYAYRLPSEAEWEYACRAGSTGNFVPELSTMGWFEPNSGSATHPVGEKKGNAWGLYDIHGNVWEWCQDVSHENFIGAPTDGSPWETGGKQTRRVKRGGSWEDLESRSSARWDENQFRGDYNLGFRLALDSDSRTPAEMVSK